MHSSSPARLSVCRRCPGHSGPGRRMVSTRCSKRSSSRRVFPRDPAPCRSPCGNPEMGKSTCCRAARRGRRAAPSPDRRERDCAGAASRGRPIRAPTKMQRVGVGAAAILYGREHPPAAVMLEQRRIARDHAGDKGGLLDPAVRERSARYRSTVAVLQLSGTIHISPPCSNTNG